MLHTSPSLDTESPKKIKNVLMGARYMLPNSRIKGFQLELPACCWMHLKVDGFMGAVFPFTEDHREITNPAAYNVSMTKYVVATDPVLLFLFFCFFPSFSSSSLFEYKTHQLSSAWKRGSLLWGWLPTCFGLIWLYAFILLSTPVGPSQFNSHYQCPTHVGLPPTVLVAHWPQQGAERANPLWSPNGSRTIAWHLEHSQGVTKWTPHSLLGNNREDNVTILFLFQDISIRGCRSTFKKEPRSIARGN